MAYFSYNVDETVREVNLGTAIGNVLYNAVLSELSGVVAVGNDKVTNLSNWSYYNQNRGVIKFYVYQPVGAGPFIISKYDFDNRVTTNPSVNTTSTNSGVPSSSSTSDNPDEFASNAKVDEVKQAILDAIEKLGRPGATTTTNINNIASALTPVLNALQDLRDKIDTLATSLGASPDPNASQDTTTVMARTMMNALRRFGKAYGFPENPNERIFVATPETRIAGLPTNPVVLQSLPETIFTPASRHSGFYELSSITEVCDFFASCGIQWNGPPSRVSFDYRNNISRVQYSHIGYEIKFDGVTVAKISPYGVMTLPFAKAKTVGFSDAWHVDELKTTLWRYFPKDLFDVFLVDCALIKQLREKCDDALRALDHCQHSKGINQIAVSAVEPSSSRPKFRTAYDILGVNIQDPIVNIREAYKKLVMRYHPDKGGDAKKFKEVTLAYNAVKSEAKRAEYNEILFLEDVPEDLGFDVATDRKSVV